MRPPPPPVAPVAQMSSYDFTFGDVDPSRGTITTEVGRVKKSTVPSDEKEFGRIITRQYTSPVAICHKKPE